MADLEKTAIVREDTIPQQDMTKKPNVCTLLCSINTGDLRILGKLLTCSKEQSYDSIDELSLNQVEKYALSLLTHSLCYTLRDTG